MRDSRFVKLICAAAACACICTSSAMAKNEEKNLYTMNLMQTGESDGNDYVTRAEFAAILVRGFEVAAANQNSSFEDMEGHWAKEYAAVVYDAGISKGIGDGKFGPQYPVTLNQAVKMIISAIGYVPTEDKYPDAYIQIGNAKGLMEGVEDGERVLTRSDAATLIMNGLNLYKITYNAEGKESVAFDKFISKLGYTVVNSEAKKVEVQTMNLWEDGQMPYKLDNLETEQVPDIKAYLVENNGEKTGAVVLFPGGAYHHMSQIESAQLPAFYNSQGLNVFTVNYRVEPYTYKAILSDAFRAIRYVRYNAEKFNIDASKIGVAGCSAGGHLASCTATMFDEAEKCIGDEIDEVSARPDFTVFGYPVISMSDEYTHVLSRARFLGTETPSEEDIEKFSNELNVTENTPPAFLFHTEFDGVNVMNSINYAAALKKNNVPFEIHIYPEAGHGYAVGFGKERADEWTKSCSDWLRFMDVIK